MRVCVHVLETHPSVTLPQTSGASPFDACSTVTKPSCTHTPLYCTNQHNREKLHCFSLTSDTVSLQFLAHKMLSSFVPCFNIMFVQWTKSGYFVIFKEIYRYICIVYIMMIHYIYLLLFMWLI